MKFSGCESLILAVRFVLQQCQHTRRWPFKNPFAPSRGPCSTHKQNRSLWTNARRYRFVYTKCIYTFLYVYYTRIYVIIYIYMDKGTMIFLQKKSEKWNFLTLLNAAGRPYYTCIMFTPFISQTDANCPVAAGSKINGLACFKQKKKSTKKKIAI